VQTSKNNNKKSFKERMDILAKTLEMNFEPFKQEIKYGMHGDTNMLQLIKYLCWEIYKCMEIPICCFFDHVLFLLYSTN